MEDKNGKSGVFWVIDGELLAILYDENTEVGISKSGRNYNHRLLWESVKPPKCNKDFDYYPRGRVEIGTRGVTVIYLSPHIDQDMVVQIKDFFGLPDDVKVHYDGSNHYKCYLDS